MEFTFDALFDMCSFDGFCFEDLFEELFYDWL